MILAQLAIIAAMQDRPNDAKDRYREALGILQDVEDVANYAGVAAAFGEFLLKHSRGSQNEGCQMLEQAAQLYEQMGAEEARATARRLGCAE